MVHDSQVFAGLFETSAQTTRRRCKKSFVPEEKFVELIGPDNKDWSEIWNGITGVKPVTEVRQPEGGDQAHQKGVSAAVIDSVACSSFTPESRDSLTTRASRSDVARRDSRRHL